MVFGPSSIGFSDADSDTTMMVQSLTAVRLELLNTTDTLKEYLQGRATLTEAEVLGARAAVDAIHKRLDDSSLSDLSEQYIDQYTLWMFFSVVLLFFLQTGVGMMEQGVVRAKNVRRVLNKHLLQASITSLTFWAVGYNMAYKSLDPLDNGSRWQQASAQADNTKRVSNVHFCYNLMCVVTVAGMTSGAMAERGLLQAELSFTTMLTSITVPVVMSQVWDGGFLSPFGDNKLFGVGMIDYGGNGVLSLVGGMASIIAAVALGPRLDESGRMRFSKGARMQDFEGLDTIFHCLGISMVWFSWYGFINGGALRPGVSLPSTTASLVAVNITLGGAMGLAASFTINLLEEQLFMNRIGRDTTDPWRLATRARDDELTFRFNYKRCLNGALAGLVTVNAGSAVVQPWVAALTALLGGIAHVACSHLLVYLKIDDPMDMSSVHLVAGSWGLVSVALFADRDLVNRLYADSGITFSDGLLWDMLGAQVIGMGCIMLWTAGTCLIFLVLVHLPKLFGLRGLYRMTRAQEIRGVDASRHMYFFPPYLWNIIEQLETLNNVHPEVKNFMDKDFFNFPDPVCHMFFGEITEDESTHTSGTFVVSQSSKGAKNTTTRFKDTEVEITSMRRVHGSVHGIGDGPTSNQINQISSSTGDNSQSVGSGHQGESMNSGATACNSMGGSRSGPEISNTSTGSGFLPWLMDPSQMKGSQLSDSWPPSPAARSEPVGTSLVGRASRLSPLSELHPRDDPVVGGEMVPAPSVMQRWVVAPIAWMRAALWSSARTPASQNMRPLIRFAVEEQVLKGEDFYKVVPARRVKLKYPLGTLNATLPSRESIDSRRFTTMALALSHVALNGASCSGLASTLTITPHGWVACCSVGGSSHSPGNSLQGSQSLGNSSSQHPDSILYGYFSVMDGHNGKMCGATTEDRLLQDILRAMPTCDTEEEWLALLPQAIVQGYQDCNREFVATGKLSGCTATSVFLNGWTVTCGNVGDSACYVDNGQQVLQLSADHRIDSNPEELTRLLVSGQRVQRLRLRSKLVGPLRAWPGGLCLARSIGDVDVGPNILGIPEVSRIRLSPRIGGRVVVASDGLWDGLENPEEAIESVRGLYTKDAGAGGDGAALTQLALRKRGLRDDLTVIVVDVLPRILRENKDRRVSLSATLRRKYHSWLNKPTLFGFTLQRFQLKSLKDIPHMDQEFFRDLDTEIEKVREEEETKNKAVHLQKWGNGDAQNHLVNQPTNVFGLIDQRLREKGPSGPTI